MKNNMNLSQHILVIDGSNYMHRARSGFGQGEFNVVFTFFRMLRYTIEQMKPSRVYFVLDGRSGKRKDIDPAYKANRKIITDEELDTLKEKEHDEWVKQNQKRDDLFDFFKQKDMIIDLLKTAFPVSVILHEDHEADDMIYNLIKKSSSAVPWTVLSSDSDFIQLLNEFDHVKLYNPITKKYIEKPTFDYVSWKSLRGDGSDNVAGIKGIGDKKAEKLVTDQNAMNLFFEKNPEAKCVFEHNLRLIKFLTFDDDDLMKVKSSIPTFDKEQIVKVFESMQFNSILKSWKKFVATFETLVP